MRVGPTVARDLASRLNEIGAKMLTRHGRSDRAMNGRVATDVELGVQKETAAVRFTPVCSQGTSARVSIGARAISFAWEGGYG